MYIDLVSEWDVAAFEFMLQNERIPAHLLAIDRPSPKFLSFFKDIMNNDYDWMNPGISSHSQSHMGAGQEMYSRHGVSSISNINQYRSTPTRGRYTPTRISHMTLQGSKLIIAEAQIQGA
ncbi:hypothetical protein Btru_069495 [Bulinus truncatus]|nr:hypothetical protein Btru_069495 [Bulinus truncatus]